MDSEAYYQYLLSLKSVRSESEHVFKAAEDGHLLAFDFHADKLDNACDVVCDVILRSNSPEQFGQILPHGRWQHFETQGVPRLERLSEEWKVGGIDELECSRRLVDLFLVSVLLDAGAGDVWQYEEKSTGLHINRSEGLAVASFYAFTDGLFSANGVGVDAAGLRFLTTEKLSGAMQSSKENPLLGIEGRVQLLQSLGSSLSSLPDIFGATGRPGNIVDHLLKSKSSPNTIDLSVLWDCLQKLLIPTWPEGRTVYNRKPLGDAWPLKVSGRSNDSSKPSIQPFHKLTQWLTYSLTVIFERILGIKWTGTEHLTGLPEYRNGGLYVDTGVLTLKPDVLKRGLETSKSGLPMYNATGEEIVEWRALTVALLDRTLVLVNEKLAIRTEGIASPLTLAQLLEAGTWKAGRELAAKLRPESKGSPILMLSDGTLF